MKLDAGKICFGLTEEIDRQSLAIFLQLGGQEKFAELFASRLSSEEILEYVDLFTALLKKHTNEDEYHQIFLGDTRHHNHKE